MPTLNTKSRTELKAYFKKGLRPTEAQFAEFIDSGINTKDDGLAKSGGSPLQIQADISPVQKVIEFYKAFTDSAPAWTQQLRSLTPDGSKGESGLSFQRDSKMPTLFLSENAQVGIRTFSPGYDLDVNGTVGVTTGANINQIVIGMNPLKYPNAIKYPYETLSTSEKTANLRLHSFGIIGFHPGGSGEPQISMLNDGSLKMFNGAIIPKEGDSDTSGILFPLDAFGGGGDRASIRYKSKFPGDADVSKREQTILEIRNENDANDDVNIVATGTVNVMSRLNAGNSDLYFMKTDHLYVGIGDAPGCAAIENDKAYDALMILGRRDVNSRRTVKLWDYLEVYGNIKVNGDIHYTGELKKDVTIVVPPDLGNPTGPIIGGGIGVHLPSDERSKIDIEPLRYGLKEIKNLNPVSYNWKSMENPQRSIGLIAQAVKPVIKEVVSETLANPDGHNWGISYVGLIPVLINAIKELDQKLEAAQLKIQQLQS